MQLELEEAITETEVEFAEKNQVKAELDNKINELLQKSNENKKFKDLNEKLLEQNDNLVKDLQESQNSYKKENSKI